MQSWPGQQVWVQALDAVPQRPLAGEGVESHNHYTIVALYSVAGSVDRKFEGD